MNVFLFLNVVCLNAFDLYKYIHECRIKNRGPLFKYSHTKWHFMLMYINIHKKIVLSLDIVEEDLSGALSSKFNKKCLTYVEWS